MLHPRLTSLDGTQLWLAQIGPFGAWADLTLTTRWDDGACGNYEAKWTMPLPPQFEHPLLRRGSLVELYDGSYRVGSPFVLSEPAIGSGFDDPWQLVATGIGRDVEGENSWAALDTATGTTTTKPSAAIDTAIANGLRVGGRAASVPTSSIGGTTSTDEVQSCGSLFNAAAQSLNKRWGVGQDNLLYFASDPTTPTYQVVPGAAALGTADDGYASVVWLRYVNSATGLGALVASQNLQVEARFGRREYLVNLIDKGAIATATAQAWADSILALSKGRLAWTNSLTLTSNQLLTIGGVPADLGKAAEDVGAGLGMVRLNGIWDDLLESTGNTYLDVVMGEAQYVDGAQTIQLAPMGLAARDLASVIEQVTGYQDAA